MKTITISHWARLAGMSLAGAIAIGTGSITGGAAHADPSSSDGAVNAIGAFRAIRNAASNQCLQPQGGSTGEALIVPAPCLPANDRNADTQSWIFRSASGVLQIVNQRSGFCMYMNGPIASGSPVIQAGCSTVSNELWRVSPAPPSVGEVRSWAGHGDTHLCLDLPVTGAAVQIFPCDGGIAQHWIML